MPIMICRNSKLYLNGLEFITNIHRLQNIHRINWEILPVQKQGTQLRAQRSIEMLEAYAEHDAVAALHIFLQ